MKLIEIDWEELEPLLDAQEAVRRGSLVSETNTYERGDYERGLAEADAVVEADYRTQTLNHNSMETHQCVCAWRGDAIEVHVSTQYIWGIRRDLAKALGMPPGQGARHLRVHGRRLRLEDERRQLPHAGRRARAPHRASRCAAR